LPGGGWPVTSSRSDAHRLQNGNESASCENIRFCPGGTLDNSPAIYRWVAKANDTESPGGTIETPPKRRFSRPSGTIKPLFVGYPALKCWAIINRPSGTNSRRSPVFHKPIPTRFTPTSTVLAFNPRGAFHLDSDPPIWEYQPDPPRSFSTRPHPTFIATRG